jgi:hypothetical protein
MRAPGPPASYYTLTEGVTVRSSDGVRVGEVKRVLADLESDIFDGLVLRTPHAERFVAASRVSEIYERLVVLSITADEAGRPPPAAAGPACRQGRAGRVRRPPTTRTTDGAHPPSMAVRARPEADVRSLLPTCRLVLPGDRRAPRPARAKPARSPRCARARSPSHDGAGCRPGPLFSSAPFARSAGASRACSPPVDYPHGSNLR